MQLAIMKSDEPYRETLTNLRRIIKNKRLESLTNGLELSNDNARPHTTLTKFSNLTSISRQTLLIVYMKMLICKRNDIHKMVLACSHLTLVSW